MSLKIINNNVINLAVGSSNVSAAYIGSTQIYNSVAGTPASLLLHFDGNLNDSSANGLQVSAGANATISVAEYRFGSGSASFVGDGYLTVADSEVLNLQSGDWTVELWFRPTDLTLPDNLIVINSTEDSYAQVRIASSIDGVILFTANEYDMPDWMNLNFTLLPQANQWYHLAATRSGDIIRFFINGEKVTEYSSNGLNLRSQTGVHTIGGLINYDTANCYIDEVRIVKGLAVYTGPFTPPTAPLPAVATRQTVNASLLLNFDGSFTDESANELTVTPAGGAAISTTTKKFGSGSLSLNGTDAYLSVPLNVFSGDWTIEAWVYFNDLTGEQAIVELYDPAVDAGFVLIKLDSANANDGNKPFFYAGGVSVYNVDDVRFATEQWYHVAAVRNAGTVSLYLNGVFQGRGTASMSSLPEQDMTIGARSNETNLFNGFIDGLRITQAALYCDSFTPPASPPTPTVIPPTCICGCTDSGANNYNPSATCDDGSCIYCNYGCMDNTASNYNPSATCDDGSCIPCVYGCIDNTASNYDPYATCDDGSCIPCVYGCTDNAAFNYDPAATCDDGSCIPCVYGCMNPANCEYNPAATCDNDCSHPGGCCETWPGCTDPGANNYDRNAGCDDGSCCYSPDPATLDWPATAAYSYNCTGCNSVDIYITDSCGNFDYIVEYSSMGRCDHLC